MVRVTHAARRKALVLGALFMLTASAAYADPTPVRVTVRPMLLDAQVMLGERGLPLCLEEKKGFEERNDLSQLILDAPTLCRGLLVLPTYAPSRRHPVRTLRGGPIPIAGSSKGLL